MKNLDVEVIAHMVRPLLVDSNKICLIILMDGPRKDEEGPFVLKHQTAILSEQDQSVWPLAQVAKKWAKEILGE